MKTRMRGLSCLVALTLVACSDRPPPAAPKTAVPAASAPTIDIGPAVRKALGGDWEAHYFDAAVDLDGDGKPEVVALAAGPMVCGTGGCPVFVFAHGPEGVRLVTQIAIVQPPVRVSPRRSNGWRNLIVGIGGGGIPAAQAELKFDGKTYPTNPTVPPADAAPGVEGAAMLIPEFKSYKDGKPVPAPAAGAQSGDGDPQALLAGRVLGTEIRTGDAEELRYVVLRQLTDRYAARRGIEVTQAEKDEYVRHVQAALKKDRAQRAARRDELTRKLQAEGLPDAERKSLAAELDMENKAIAALAEDTGNPDEVRAAREQIAAAFIRQWKINQALYKQYGGRIIFQQGGPEPLDAYRTFLEEARARGDFEILNKDLETAFWRYYVTDSIHSFYKPGSREEAQVFASPPWRPTT